MFFMHNGAQDVEEVIRKLIEKFGASNESHLAEMIGVHRSTISAWRSRGRVPDRYVSLLTQGGPVGGMGRGPIEVDQAEVRRLLAIKGMSGAGQAAVKLALFRFLQDSEGVLDSFPDTLKALSLGMTALSLGAAQALEEIEGRRRQSDCSPQEALAMIVHEEMIGRS